MSGDSIGKRLRVTSFGESHGPCVGVVVEGCPSGLKLEERQIQEELDRRRPGRGPLFSLRDERDRVYILSGVFRNRATGAPICLLIRNEGADSSPYEAIRGRPRPGHADFVARVKYGCFNDYRGGGRFSGRITAGFVAAGAIAKALLRSIGVEIFAHAKEIAGIRAEEFDFEAIKERSRKDPLGCADPVASGRMADEISKARSEGDSVGGIVECIALNVPIGLGEPVFDTLDGDLAKAFFAIPGVKGVELGAGFSASRMRGSQNNDPIVLRDGRIETLTNNAGGILGGMSNGMPIICRIAIKPTPSIRRPQRSVDLERMEEVEVTVEGAHDPCIVPRAIPVVEAVAAVILADHALRGGFIRSPLRE